MDNLKLAVVIHVLTVVSSKSLVVTKIVEGGKHYSTIKPHVEFLCSIGMLEKEKRRYRTTDKGREFLAEFRKLMKLLGQNPWDLKCWKF